MSADDRDVHELELETCWQCGGDGGFHDCGEDSCCCRNPDINRLCDICDGHGLVPEPTHTRGDEG